MTLIQDVVLQRLLGPEAFAQTASLLYLSLTLTQVSMLGGVFPLDRLQTFDQLFLLQLVL